MDSLWLIAGLGNPGREYLRTRHNAGFLLVETLAERWGGSWTEAPRQKAKIARTKNGGHTVLLAQPQTYMNASGESLRALVDFYKVSLARVMIAVDDADLELGNIRLRGDGSSGGHHGLESIERHLATRAYARQRLGIGRRNDGVRQIAGFVLHPFPADEWKVFESVLEQASRQLECWMADGIQPAMSRFNGAAPSARENRKTT